MGTSGTGIGLYRLMWLVHTHSRFTDGPEVCVQGWVLLSAPQETSDPRRLAISPPRYAAVGFAQGSLSSQLFLVWLQVCGQAQCLHLTVARQVLWVWRPHFVVGLRGSDLGLSFSIEFLGVTLVNRTIQDSVV